MNRKVVATIILFLVSVVFISGCGKGGAEKIAEEYFNALYANDWDTVYDLSGYEKSPFMTKENMIASYDEFGSAYKNVEIHDYTITEEENEDGNTAVRSYVIDYTCNRGGIEGSSGVIVRVGKVDGKYKVVNCGNVVTGYKIKVPAMTKVSLDSIELTDEYLAEEQEVGSITYALPQMLYKKWILKTYGEGIEPYETEVYPAERTAEARFVYLTEEMKGELVKRAVSDYSKLVKGYVADTPFEELDINFTTREEDLKKIKEWYNAQNSYVRNGEGFKSWDVASFNHNAEIDVRGASGYVECIVEYGINGVYAYSNGEIDNAVESNGNNRIFCVYYMYIDGEYRFAYINSTSY